MSPVSNSLRLTKLFAALRRDGEGARARANPEDLARQERVERGFYSIAQVLGSPVSLEQTFAALARAASQVLGGDSALVLRAAAGGYELAAAHALPDELATRVADSLAGAARGLVVAPNGRVLVSSSLADDERFEESVRSPLAQAGYAGLLVAPVSERDGPAHLVVVLFAGERAFSDDDVALARHLAGAARGALERSGFFESERRARELSERLADSGARVLTKLDPGAVTADVADEAIALVGADAAAIRLLEGDDLVVRAVSGAGGAHVVRQRAAGAGLAREVAQSRTAVAVADAASAPRFRRGDPLLERMEACVGVPMTGPGGVFRGVLTVYSSEPRGWREDEVQALVALATVASAALANAELYRRVAEEKERNEAILRNIADGIVAVDREERIVLWNAAAEQITGVPAEEALGRRVADVLQRELAAAEGGGAVEREVAILRGGKEVWLSLTEAVMRDASGEVAGRIFAFRDVSSERAVEEMKSEFVSAVSHELRTPLTSIYGFAETLLRPDVSFSDDERATFLRYLVSESERLIRIVDDLLDVARLESGAFSLAATPVDVADVAADAVARVQEEAGGQRAFVVDFPRRPLLVEADRDKLARVVFNLLDNAVKFSSADSTVTVSGRRKADVVEVRVTDEGVGIPHADQQRIFAKFYRTDAPPLAGVAGTGLGLFLVKGLLSAMGGRIWVESSEGRGASFVFELPSAEVAAARRNELEAAPQR